MEKKNRIKQGSRDVCQDAVQEVVVIYCFLTQKKKKRDSLFLTLVWRKVTSAVIF